MGTRSVKSVVIFTVLLLLAASAVGAYVYGRSSSVATASRTALHSQPSSDESGAMACTDFVKNHTHGADAKSIHQHARDLADRMHFEEALSGYSDVAEVDPGFPGLNLEISRTLLQLKQPTRAKQSINAQIAVSECLPHLPPDDLDAYCESESFPSTAACLHELNTVQQGAYIQAALVQAELGRTLSPKPSEDAAAPLPAAAPAVKPSHTLVASRNADKAVKLRPAKNPAGNPLASGSGTDAALGAYSK